MLGEGEEVYGLNVFMGDIGFDALARLTGIFVGQEPPTYHELDLIYLHLDSKSQVEESDRRKYNRITGQTGIPIGGVKHWPHIRRLEPWLAQRPTNASECEFLSHVLEQACHMARRLRSDPGALFERFGAFCIRVLSSEEGEAHWSDR